jgi:hypothetical protein
MNRCSIWNNCVNCKVNCCKRFESHKLFLTFLEKKELKHINKTFPCFYLNKGGNVLFITKDLLTVIFGPLI